MTRVRAQAVVRVRAQFISEAVYRQAVWDEGSESMTRAQPTPVFRSSFVDS